MNAQFSHLVNNKKEMIKKSTAFIVVNRAHVYVEGYSNHTLASLPFLASFFSIPNWYVSVDLEIGRKIVGLSLFKRRDGKTRHRTSIIGG